MLIADVQLVAARLAADVDANDTAVVINAHVDDDDLSWTNTMHHRLNNVAVVQPAALAALAPSAARALLECFVMVNLQCCHIIFMVTIERENKN